MHLWGRKLASHGEGVGTGFDGRDRDIFIFVSSQAFKKQKTKKSRQGSSLGNDLLVICTQATEPKYKVRCGTTHL